MAPRVVELFIYPVKACQGISVDEARLTPHGALEYDREWCILDLRGDRYPAMQSLSQRNCPALASISVALEPATAPTQLVLTAPGSEQPLTVKLQRDGTRIDCAGLSSRDGDVAKIDNSTGSVAVECGGASTTSAGAWHLGLLRGWDEGDAASAWLSRVLNADVIKTNAQKKEASAPPAKVAEFRLVRAAGVRALATYAGPTQVPFSEDVSQQRLGAASPFKMQHVPVQAHDGMQFSDVAPMHLCSLASLRDLKVKLALLDPPPSAEEVANFSVRAFRPNVVVDGSSPWDEEDWANFELGAKGGEIVARLLKPCPRCTVPARAPFTGSWHFQARPLLAPQMALRKFWPAKCKDAEWEVEWEGPIFGVHLGIDTIAKEVTNSNFQLRVGDSIQVSRRKNKRLSSDCRIVLGAIAALVLAIGVAFLIGGDF